MKIIYRGITKVKKRRTVEIQRKERDDVDLFEYIMNALQTAGWTATEITRDNAADAVEITVSGEAEFIEIKKIYQEIKNEYN